MTIYHMHHIIPRHMGGTDDPSNLIKLTIEEHAQAHLDLYNKHGDERDLVAHRMLLGQIDKAEAIKIIQKLPKTESWKKKKSESMLGEKNHMYGKTTSDNQKLAVSRAMKGKKKDYKVHCNWPTLIGSDNPRARKVYAEGVIYNTVKECCEAYGMKNHNAIRYRCNHKKWTEWRFID